MRRAIAETRPIAETLSGPVVGRPGRSGARCFAGIPFAAAPTGPARWAAPGPVAPWSAPRDATRPGPAPPQPDTPLGAWFHGPLAATSEDCLTLNVWTPSTARRGADLPVLVWLYGGGFLIGWSGAPLYDGAALAESGQIIVVAPNYRLGSLGWLAHPELSDDGSTRSGNWGMLDQLAALRWINANIAHFGGDPRRMTLGGQSAGAASVLNLLGSPATTGLFGKAIVQSPMLRETAISPEPATRWADALNERLTKAHRVDLDALRRIPATDVVRAHQDLLLTEQFAGTRGGALPVLDGVTITAAPDELADVRPDIDVLIGTTADEATFLFRTAGRRLDPGDARLAAMLETMGAADAGSELAAQRAHAHSAGLPDDNNSVLCRVATARLFTEPVAQWSASRTAAGGQVHRYRVEHPAADPELGATHGVELPLLFGTCASAPQIAGSDARAAATSDALGRTWSAFVRDEPLDWPSLQPDGNGEIGVLGGASEPLTTRSTAAELSGHI